MQFRNVRNTLRFVETPDDSRARPDLFASVFVLAQHLGHLGDAALVPLGLTTRQWLLLAVVQTQFPGRRPTLSEAAAIYGSSRQNVKAIAAALEERGYLRLVDDPADHRAVLLEVTPKVAVFQAPSWIDRQTEFFHQVFDGLDDSEVGQLLALIRQWLGLLASANPSSNESVDQVGSTAGRSS